MLIKFCGLKRQVDVSLICKFNADFCGFIFHKSSPRYISPSEAANLDTGKLLRTGVFVNEDINEILDIMNIARLDYVQMHGSQSIEWAWKIGPHKIIRVLWPERYSSIMDLHKAADKFASSCAYFLFDSGKQSGGSGKCFDWKLLKNATLPRPWFLAGGLDINNIKKALDSCSPAGIDINSGVEIEPGIKDHDKIGKILEQI